jgi:hypothetical protein
VPDNVAAGHSRWSERERLLRCLNSSKSKDGEEEEEEEEEKLRGVIVDSKTLFERFCEYPIVSVC